MITRMNRFSITWVHITTRTMKYMKLALLPHVSPSMHPCSFYRLQSNIILFQSSPVDTAKSKTKAEAKSPKFFRSSMTSPRLTSRNSELPLTANMKKMSIRSMKTLASEGIENMIV